MILHLLTLNVCGLNEGFAVDALQGYIKTCTFTLDLVAVQEHKLRGSLFTHIG